MLALYLLFVGLTLCKAQYDYSQLLQYSLLFYEAERSGKLPPDQKVTWRHDSALGDKGQNGEDLTGGYYDAGDFVKFGFPMAYTVTVISWGIVSHEAGFVKANALDDARKAVQWGTDYLLKCHISENELYGQVGQGQLDHDFWGRPEEMTMARPPFKIDTSHPGSDLAGETAAALAAASIVFKNVNPEYSNTLLTHAKQLFNFANNYRGIYSDSITDAANFYRSYGFEDELVWAGAWLYKATGDNSYLTTTEQLYDEFGLINANGGFSWDQKISGAEVLLADATKNSKYTDKVKGYCDWMLNSQQRTPLGLVYIDVWGSLRHAANAALICLQAADLGISSAEYRAFAKQQIGYMLGDTGRSYVAGFGNNPPQFAHHRSSSCPNLPDPCDWNSFNSPQPNPQILHGALVGGPDANDNYVDSRQDSVHNEVACDYNAGFQSALAALNVL